MPRGLGTYFHYLITTFVRSVVFKISPWWSPYFYDLCHLVQLGKVSAGLIHDLASPLAILQLTLDDASLSQGPDLQRSKAALRLMQTYLDFARQQLLTDTQLSSVHLYSLLTQTHHLVKTLADQHRIRIKIECPRRLRVLSSSPLISKIILNMVTNAIEAFGQDAFPKSRLIVIKVETMNQTVRITINDNAGGISQSLLSQMFRPQPFTTKPQHLGLGLTLCREWAAQLGGTLKVISDFGQGSTFALEIPHLRDSSSSTRMNN